MSRGRRITRVELSNGVESFTATLYSNGSLSWQYRDASGRMLHSAVLHNHNPHTFQEMLSDYRYAGWHTVTIK